ncbi:MAG: hypothetical protein IPQ07_38900 [Myxococcales bacterium]|nr:hypothetical protein [Myxococcales bacterium]
MLRPLVVAAAVAGCAKPAPPRPLLPAPAARADALTACERPQGTPTAIANGPTLFIQASGPSFESIERFDIDLIEDGSSLLPSVILRCSPGVVAVSGLSAAVPASTYTPAAHSSLEIVISAPGYLPQRRRTTLGPGTNSAYFILGRPGMQFYQQGDTLIPYSRAKARHLVLASPGQPSNLTARVQALTSAFKRAPLKVWNGDPTSPPWYRGVVEVEAIFDGGGAGRKRAIGDLASHLRDHPEQGTLVVLLAETARGGRWFSGNIDVTFRTLLDRDQLTAFTTRHDLVVVHAEGGRATFAMRAPDADFPDLIDKIREDIDVVSDVSPVIQATIEIDTRG